MKKRIFLLAVPLIIMSCSDNDSYSILDDSNAISFNAITEKVPRGATTTASTLKSFSIYAYSDNKLYMDDVTVTRVDGLWTYSPKKYWPANPVNFYAFSPDTKGFTGETPTSAPKITNYTINGSDLLYASNIGEIPKPQPVQINFRHALSKIDVLLASSNPDITVEVYHIIVSGMNGTGTFVFPQSTTSASSVETVGSWTNQNNPIDVMLFYAVDKASTVNLTSTPTNLTEGNLEWYFLMPQQLEDVTLSDGKLNGQYISVECVIHDKATGSKIWPNSQTPPYQTINQSEAGKLIYPVKFGPLTEWKPGYNYVYNITIKSPKELDEIDFDVTVDEYAPYI